MYYCTQCGCPLAFPGWCSSCLSPVTERIRDIHHRAQEAIEIFQRNDILDSISRDQLAAIDSIPREVRELMKGNRQLSEARDAASAAMLEPRWLRENIQLPRVDEVRLEHYIEPWHGLHLKEIEQLTGQLSEGVTAVSLQAQLGAFKPNLEEILNAASYAKSAWRELAANPAASYAFASMATLSEAIRQRPFADETIAAIRSQLGDWRGVVREQELFDQDKRQEFYLHAGMERRLIDLVPETFDAILDATELNPPPPPLRHAYRSADLEEVEEKIEQDGEEKQAESVQSEIEDGEPQAEERHQQAGEVGQSEAGKLQTVGEAGHLEAEERAVTDYRLLFNFESQVRGFIAEVLTKAVGPEWSKQRVPSDCLNNWKERKKARRTGKDPHALLNFADLGDWPKIIQRKDNWPHFKPYFQRQSFVEEAFCRLIPLRNDIAHMRHLTQADRLVLQVEVQQFLAAMQLDESDASGS